MKTTKSKIRCGGMLTILVLAFGLMVCLAKVGSAAPMGTAFTYQGSLNDAGSPADGLYDFEFSLYDDPCTGTQQGSTIDINDLDVIDGYFTVELDFGSGLFEGNAVWLETTVAQSNGSDPCTLTPRVELTPTPYALYAKTAHPGHSLDAADGDPVDAVYVDNEGEVGIGTTNPLQKLHISDFGMASLLVHETTNDVVGQLMADTDYVSLHSVFSHPLRFLIDDITRVFIDTNGNVGIGTTNPDEKLTVEGTIKVSTSKPSGYGVYSEATNSGYYVNFGGYFVAAGYNGAGVCGEATGGIGLGVYGEAANTGNYTNYGGFFKASGQQGRGVSGVATNSGNYVNYGGYFKASGQQGRGVYGEASTGEVNYGGYFKAAGNNGAGVYGEATGLAGRAVHGEASGGGNGSNYGGYFTANGQTGRGVFGLATGSNGKGVQAWGEQYDFYANGPGLDYGANSSIRWKSDVRVIDDPLGKVMNLRGVYFNWDDEHGGHHDVGMIAEEVGEVMPEIVVYEENGIDANGMEYGKLTPLLVEAVKELKVENDSLKERVEALERTMLQLAKVKELEL